MPEFVHLHVHSEYSLLDGASRIGPLVRQAAELGMQSLALTDHGVMFGVVDFYKECRKHNIRPIIGCEVYTASRRHQDRDPRLDSDQGHLVLLARDLVGYGNLMKLVSTGFVDGYYYKPRIDMDDLRAHSRGLIALSACLAGDVPNALLRGDEAEARRKALELSEIMGPGNFYLELQHNGLEEQIGVNRALVKLSKETGIPLVATNDVHYVHRHDARAQDILLCIQTGRNVDDEDRMRFGTDELYLKSPEEMAAHFADVPEAIENTVRIAEQCRVDFTFGAIHLPTFAVPDGEDAFAYLEHLCREGYAARYGGDGSHLERLEYELRVIRQMGYVDYFLIVWDFIRYARDHGIMVGPGRGSAAGSIVAYCLRITNVDPIRYSLLFERFLNPERISMPDIDIDFCYERRQEVIEYVIRKYGADRVAQIITFGTMAARAAVRDVGRALAIPYGDVDRVAKLIPMMPGKHVTIDEAIGMVPDLKKLFEEDARIRDLLETAKTLEGMPRHASTHAAGVVISGRPITDFVPLYRNNDLISTQFPMGTLEELGLLKMDFLALRTLTVIRDAVSMIADPVDGRPAFDIDAIDFGDPAVYALISRGETSGIFQLESQGMTNFMRELQPTTLEDIIAGISLYRPGPMDQIPRYIRSKNNPDRVTYLHPSLEPILNVTYGCMVYQEQVMQIVRELGGYSYGRSDLVRRAMSKKKKEVMDAERQTFIHGQDDDQGHPVIAGALRNGIDERTANVLFDEMMDFASYAFNKSHAAAYAVVGYQTAWLKTHHPVEFMAALMNSFVGSLGKISEYVLECRRMGIAVLQPDINESRTGFSVTDGVIRFGLSAVKNVGLPVIHGIMAERQRNGRFRDFIDFVERLEGRDFNKRTVESLIKCGAFDSFGIYRSRMIAGFESIMDGVASARRRKMDGQVSLFDAGSASGEPAPIAAQWPQISEYDSRLLLAMEKEMLGLYLSGHPLDDCSDVIRANATATSQDFTAPEEGAEQTPLEDGQLVRVAGIIHEIKSISTKSNRMMAFVTLEDLYGQLEVILFPNILEQHAALVEREMHVWCDGRVSIKEDEQPKLLADRFLPLTKDTTELPPLGRSFGRSGRGQGRLSSSAWNEFPPFEAGAGTPAPQAPIRNAAASPDPLPIGASVYASDAKAAAGLQPIEPAREPETTYAVVRPAPLKVRVPDGCTDRDRNALLALMRFFDGRQPCTVYSADGRTRLMKCLVDPNPVLLAELTERVGADNVKVP